MGYYDVIIVGARCAGSSLARLLARDGAKVLLVDRSALPSEIPHGHFIHRDGPRRLQRWGLLDDVAALCTPITEQLIDLGDFPLVCRDLRVDGAAWGYGPRRAPLDLLLAEAAVAAGAELRDRFSVEALTFDGDRVTGVRGRTAGGTVVNEQAAITIGADGKHSRVAAAVQAATYDTAPTILCYYFSYWSGIDSCQFELYQRSERRRVIFAFKTDDERFAIFVGAPIDELPAIKSDLEGHMMRAFDLVPSFGERVRAGRREERIYGATDLPNFYRKPYGAGWALAGDAGCHKDPYMALGIADALRDADLLAGSLSEALGARRPWDEALAGYEQQRNAASAGEYQENLRAARFEPLPAEIMRIRQAVRSDPAQATRLSMARFGMIDRREFFNPENLQRLLGSAPAG
jgi:flavin-dependent dehydrogenase